MPATLAASHMGAREWSLLFLLSILWGGSFFFFSAILLGVAFLNESVTTQALTGMLLIGVGLAAIDGRLPTAIRKMIAAPSNS